MRKKPFTMRMPALTGLCGAAGIIVFFLGISSICSAKELLKAVKYPARPIRVMVSASAGGSLGNEIRTIAPFLEKNLGAPTVIDYVTGADGMIAYNKIYQEKTDGYTIIYCNLISSISLELTRETAKYHVKEYALIGGWNAKYLVLVVNPDTWKTFPEFLSDAKKKTLSLAGTGGHTVLTVKLLESALGIKFNLVPYPSAGEGIAAVAGKHVDCLLTFETTPKPMIQAGRLRALAVISLKPNPILPGVPNLKELGHGDVTTIPAYGIFAAPPNTPKEIVAVLEKAVSRAVTVPEFNKIAENLGIYVDFLPSSELRKAAVDQFAIVDKFKQFLK